MDERHHMYKRCQEEMFAAEQEGKLFLFAPSQEMKMSTYEMDPATNQALYDLGVKDFERMEESVKEFLLRA